MKRRKRLAVLPLVIAFFMGAITTLLFLVPGKTGPTLLVNGDAKLQRGDFGSAGKKIERLGDKLLECLYRSKEAIQKGIDKSD